MLPAGRHGRRWIIRRSLQRRDRPVTRQRHKRVRLRFAAVSTHGERIKLELGGAVLDWRRHGPSVAQPERRFWSGTGPHRDDDRPCAGQRPRESHPAQFRARRQRRSLRFPLRRIDRARLLPSASLTQGLAPVALACLKKAARLYGLHLLLTFCALAIFGGAYWLAGGADAVIAPHGRAVVFEEPLRGGLGVALLSHQLGYFNILPLYVVLMALTPAILALARFSPAAALAASLSAYALVRVTGFDLPNWPEPGGWFFNPLAWQLIFTLGVLAGARWRDQPPHAAPLVQALSLALAVGGTLIVTDGLSPRARPARRRFRRARHRQAKPWLGAARRFYRHRLSAGDDTVFRRQGAHFGRRRGAAARSPLACRCSPSARC